MFCVSCGKHSDDGWKFCRHCGKPLPVGGEESARDKPVKPIAPKLGLCYNYNGKGCEETSGCIFIHMCKNYVESRCESGKECCKSHDILKPDVKAKLEKHGINTKRRPKEILVDLREAVRGKTRYSRDTEDCARSKSTKQASQKLGLCYHYNGKGCEKTGDCTFIHMCKNYVESRCESGKECSKGHNILHPDIKAKLEKHGIDTKRKPKEILVDLREAVRGDGNQRGSGDSAQSRAEITSGKSTTETAPKLRLCYHYNGKSCERSSCHFIHMCKSYVESKCKYGKECSKSHDILHPDVKAKLEKHGIDTKRKPKEILADLKVVVCSVASKNNDDSGWGDSNIGMTPSICFFYISRGNCRWGKSCFNVHSDLPYQWRWKLQSEKPSSWQTVSSRENIEIENKYCDPASQDYKFNIGQGSVLVKFNSMTGQDDTGNVYNVQRLSTASSLQYEHKPLTTVWIWYWRDENGKIKKYGNEAGLTGKTSNVSCSDIEQAYINNPDGQLPFTTTQFEYVIDFSKMVQRNVTHETEREIVRRPIFLSESDVKEQQQDLQTGRKATSDTTHSSMVRAPTSWQIPSGADIVDHCKMVQITSTDDEYKVIEAMFHKTLPSISIKSIERIENGDLWWNYESKRQKMLKKKNESQVGERRLFHGTKSQYIDPIWHQGFDFRLSGQTSGTVYGQGAYFALNASYSNSYTEHGSDKAMFVAKVLPGEYVRGKSEYRRPPHKEKDNMSSDLFDSCVNNEADPDIFIIFHNDQTYPEYLIRY